MSKVKGIPDEAIEKLDKFEDQVKSLTLDELNKAPALKTEQQTLMSQEDIEKSKRIYLKPSRSIGSREPFNEKYRDDYNFSKEYVQFIAENSELVGCNIDIWTKTFPGAPAEYWEVPTNKPVWGPRYLAEQITKCRYHRLVMEDKPVSQDGNGMYYGQMAAKHTINRLDAHPVSSRKSIFMGG